MFVTLASVLLLGACGGDSGIPPEEVAADLLTKSTPLTQDERERLEDAVLRRVENVVFQLTNPVSATAVLEVQYGPDGRIEFNREKTKVLAPDQAGEIRESTAIIVLHYTGEPLLTCDGEDTGREKVIQYDSRFGGISVSIAENAPDMDTLTISIADETVEDLGEDDGKRGFQTRTNGQSVIFYDIDALPSQLSVEGQEGIFVTFTEDTEADRITVPEDVDAPDCVE